MIENVVRKYLNKKITNKVVTEQDHIKIKVSYFKLLHIDIHDVTCVTSAERISTSQQWVKEYLGRDKNSHIYQHLQSNTQCKGVCNENCFAILDTAKTQYELSLKESLHIKSINPNLSKEKVHSTLTLSI